MTGLSLDSISHAIFKNAEKSFRSLDVDCAEMTNKNSAMKQLLTDSHIASINRQVGMAELPTIVYLDTIGEFGNFVNIATGNTRNLLQCVQMTKDTIWKRDALSDKNYLMISDVLARLSVTNNIAEFQTWLQRLYLTPYGIDFCKSIIGKFKLTSGNKHILEYHVSFPQRSVLCGLSKA